MSGFREGELRLIAISLIAMVLINFVAVGMGIAGEEIGDPPQLELRGDDLVESLESATDGEIERGEISWDSIDDPDNPWSDTGLTQGPEISNGTPVTVYAVGDDSYSTPTAGWRFDETAPDTPVTNRELVNITNIDEYSENPDWNADNIAYFQAGGQYADFYDEIDKKSGTIELEDGSEFSYEVTGDIAGAGSLDYTIETADAEESGGTITGAIVQIADFVIFIVTLIITAIDLIVGFVFLFLEFGAYWLDIQAGIIENTTGLVNLLWSVIQIPLIFLGILNPLIKVINGSSWL